MDSDPRHGHPKATSAAETPASLHRGLRSAEGLGDGTELGDLFSAIAANTPDIIFIHDRELRYLMVINPQLGLSQEDMVGRFDHDILTPADADKLTQLKREVLATGKPMQVELSLLSKSGELEYFDGTYVPRFDIAGEVDGLIGYFRNVTDRRRAEDALHSALAELRQSQRAARIGSYRYDVKNDVGFASEMMKEILGIGPDFRMNVANWAALVHPDERDAMLRYLNEEVFAKRGRFDREYRILRAADQREVWVHGWGDLELDADGEVAAMLGTIQDVSLSKEAEQRFRLLAMATFEGISIIEKDRVILANEQLAAMLGYRVEELVGQSPLDFLAPESRPQVAQRFVSGDVSPAELTGLRKDGSTFPFEIRSRLLERTGPTWRISAVRDITERKRTERALRDSQEQLRVEKEFAETLLAAPADTIFVFEPDTGRAIRWNQVFRDVSGYSDEEIASLKAPDAYYHEEDLRRAERVMQTVVEKGKARVELSLVTKDGRTIPFEYTASAVADAAGAPRYVIAIGRDVTERKQAEEVLRQSDRAKSEFLAVLSHELRNPLTPIRNGLYILEHAAPGSDQARRAQAIIDRQVEHLTRLIDDLLDVTRITRGKIELRTERLELNALLQRTAEDYRTLFVAGDIQLEVRPAPDEIWVSCDPTRLAQVVGNLLQNAAKFTPRAGKTSLSLKVDPVGGKAVIEVEDSGRGIAPKMLPRVFDVFAQGDTTLDRRSGGLGLGLALVKGLVEMHGGSVSAASDGVGKGARFVVTLPLASAASLQPSPRAPQSPAGGCRVLVIEDNIDAADSLCEALRLGGHTAMPAYSGPNGLAKARVFRPDVVLCDIGLPEMDGYAVARAMRSDPELAGLTLVALTGYAQPDDVAKARQAGFDQHLAKPPTMDALAKVLSPRSKETEPGA